MKTDFKGPRKPSSGGSFAGRKKRPLKRKKCRFCVDRSEIDYKNISILKDFVTDRGKILSGGITGNCAKHQRLLTSAIKRARMLALLPFASS